MGKKQKIRSGAGDLISNSGPLHKQIEKTKLPKQKFKLSESKEIKDVKFVDPSLSSKILFEAQKQWEEEKKNKEESSNQDSRDEFDNDSVLDEDESEIIEQQTEELNDLGIDQQILENDKIANEKNKKIKGISLHDLIRQKIEEKEKGKTNASNVEDIEYKDLDPAVVKLYSEIGQILEKYRSGKIPKAFKIVPSLLNWEQILELTFPEKWTAAAMLQATKMFSATATPNQCQKFYNLVLLPRVRDDIDEFKKLHFHIYQCLFKAMYKPAAFFKGILLPLCRSGTCTLREAVVFGSVLRKVSIPQMHAAAAMLSVAEMDYNGANSHILRILIQKNYTLPFRVLDGLVFHFLKMHTHQYSELPVSWHQSLLTFVELYAKDISSEQRESLIELTKIQNHHQITLEIQRILRSSESRNEENEANVPDYAREDDMEF